MFERSLPTGAVLRPIEPWRAEEFAAHMDRAREHIRPWVGPTFVTDTVEGARATLQRYADGQARDAQRILGIWADEVLVGGVMVVAMSAPIGAEIGCWTEPAGEGHGHITAASAALVDWLVRERGLHRVEWRCRADNVRSAAVAQRLGMSFEGVLRESWPVGGVFYDKQVWSILDREWIALH